MCLLAASAPVAKAAPMPQVPVGGITDFMWIGGAGWGTTNLGVDGLSSLGDVNGDGIDDFVVAQRGSGTAPAPANSRGSYVLFGPMRNAGAPLLTNLPPDRGYRIRPTTTANPTDVRSVGDQNGDGIDDVLIVAPEGASIIYSVADAATLPACDGPLVTTSPRCVNTADPVDLDGERLGLRLINSAHSPTWFGATQHGDLNGDGEDEIVIPAHTGGVFNNLLVARNGLGELCDPDPGLCTVDLGSLDAPDLVAITPPAGKSYGTSFSSSATAPHLMAVVGDQNGDGREELVAITSTADASQTVTVDVLYGQAWTDDSVAIDAGRPETGYAIDAGYTPAITAPFEVGDADGDGADDFAVNLFGFTGGHTLLWTGGAPEPGETANAPGDSGYKYVAGSDPSTQFTIPNYSNVALGDINGDGLDDFVAGQGLVTDPNLGANSGGVLMFFGQKDPPNEIVLDYAPDQTQASVAMRVAPVTGGARLGNRLTAGDQDGDGIVDLVVASNTSNHGQANQGDVRVIPGAGLFGAATTGFAGSIGTDSATLGGTARANSRASTAWFEYGTTDSYGSETTAESIGSGNGSKPIEAEVIGLGPEITYHYRTVIENDLGLRSYGSDRTFTTAKEQGPPPSECDVNPSARGCPGFCAANPTDSACREEPVPVARLSNVIAVSASNTVRRGKRTQVRAWVTNTGDGNAQGVRICVNVPTAIVAGGRQRCQNIGNVAAGSTVRAQFRIKVRPRARKGARPTLRFTATGQGLGDRTAQVRFRVR